jgi:hypothetical protein
MRKKITVFYAWQSDTAPRFNRYLIGIALEVAARNISADPKANVDVHIDSDTQGVPGQPPVTETILAKIRNCDIFAPDFTFVGKTRAKKLLPNPNVLTEYGYALHAKSHAAMMPVMNTIYGPPEKLPFDMGHLRHPIQYSAKADATNAERRAARKGLAESFEAALRVMIAAQLEMAATQGTRFHPQTRVRAPAFFFRQGEVLASFGLPGEQEIVFQDSKAVYVRIYPTYADQPRVGLTRMRALIETRKIVCMGYYPFNGLFSRNNEGWTVIEPFGATTSQALTQAFATGELWGLNSQVFRTHVEQRSPDSIPVIGTISMEKIYTRALLNYVGVLREELKLNLPYSVELGAVGLKGCYLVTPSLEFGSGEFHGPVGKPEIVRAYVLSTGRDAEVMDILRQYLDDFYDLAAASRAAVLTDEIVAKQGLPPRLPQ